MTLLVTLIVFGVLVTLHEWGHFIVARRQGIRVEIFSIGFGPMIFKHKVKDTTYAVSLVPLGGYVKMAGDTLDNGDEPRQADEFFAKTPWQRIKVAMAGPLMNYVLAFVIFAAVFMIGSPSPTARIGELMPDMPAAKAGLMAEDRITHVNGVAVLRWEDMTRELRRSGHGSIALTIQRNDQVQEVTIPAEDESVSSLVPYRTIGVKPSGETIVDKYSVVESVVMAGQKLGLLSVLTYRSLWDIICGRQSFKQSMTGPIGIMFITGKTAKEGFVPLLHLMGLLSACLALFNFLPIPLLDGGHVVLYLVEWARRKPLNLKVQEYFQKAGLVFLLLMTVVVFTNDIKNFQVVKKTKELFVKK